MSSSTLIRWSGLLAMLGGAIWTTVGGFLIRSRRMGPERFWDSPSVVRPVPL